jgi:hypothetical protein
MIYKFIDIPGHELISIKVYNYIITNTNILSENAIWNGVNSSDMLEQVPELKEALDSLNLNVERISIVKATPKTNIRIHIDNDREPRILWPIANCKGSYTKFFDVDPHNIIKQRGIKGDIYFLVKNPSQAKQIDSLELTAPVMFKPWIAHGVWPDPDCEEHRLTMTIKFRNNTDHVFPKD